MAAADNILLGTERTEMGKGPARRARRAGLIPSVMYGHGMDPVHLDLPSHDAFLIIKDNPNAVVTIKYGDNSQLCLVKNVQVQPVSRDILHIDLQIVRRGEKVQVEVPLVVVGECQPGSQYQQEEFFLLVNVPATDIPESIEVSVEGLGEGTVLHVSDLKVDEDVEIETPAERDIVSITELVIAEEPTGEEDEGESVEVTEEH